MTMIQPRICEVFGGHCDHRDTFLHLPVSIRWRIYEYVGIVRDSHIQDLDEFEFGIGERHIVTTEDCKVTRALLRTCMQLSEEVRSFLFQHNTIIYTSFDIGWYLRRISTWKGTVISSMKDVYFILQRNAMPCEWRSCVQTPLNGDLIDDWQWAIDHILFYTPERQLRLRLICSTVDFKIARDVLAPLHDYPSRLLGLDLHFDYENHHSPKPVSDLAAKKRRIADLVKKTALAADAGDGKRPMEDFRFLDLPAEIRQHIYSYTNLVTPYRQISYQADRRDFYFDYVFCECDASVCHDEVSHRSNSFFDCKVDKMATGTWISFCKRLSTAWSSGCDCGSSPLPLLLTCRTVYNEALEYLYKHNRVVVLPRRPAEWTIFAPAGTVGTSDEERGWAKPVPVTSDATWSMLQQIGSAGIRWLRNIEIVFPRICMTSSLSDTDPAYAEWLLAVKLLASLMKQRGDSGQCSPEPGNLTIVVHIWSRLRTYRAVDDVMEEEALSIDDFDKQTLRLLTPLKALRPRLKRLFVLLEWKEHWAPRKVWDDISACKLPKRDSPGCGIGERRIPPSEQELAETEMALERVVMGNDYMSYLSGKSKEIPSPWTRNFWNGWSG